MPDERYLCINRRDHMVTPVCVNLADGRIRNVGDVDWGDGLIASTWGVTMMQSEKQVLHRSGVPVE